VDFSATSLDTQLVFARGRRLIRPGDDFQIESPPAVLSLSTVIPPRLASTRCPSYRHLLAQVWVTLLLPLVWLTPNGRAVSARLQRWILMPRETHASLPHNILSSPVEGKLISAVSIFFLYASCNFTRIDVSLIEAAHRLHLTCSHLTRRRSSLALHSYTQIR
jgi:hypothetical protein